MVVVKPMAVVACVGDDVLGAIHLPPVQRRRDDGDDVSSYVLARARLVHVIFRIEADDDEAMVFVGFYRERPAS